MDKYSDIKKRWVLNNQEKRREQARNYVKRKLEEDPETFRQKARESAKRSRLKNIEKAREKNREALRIRRASDPEAYNQKQREYRLKNKEKFRQYYLQRKDKAKEHSRDRLLKKYNLDRESFQAMLLQQEGKCAICGTSFDQDKPNIDHNHETGKTRSLLCSPCNIVLGHIEKRIRTVPDIQERFANYLKTHSN